MQSTRPKRAVAISGAIGLACLSSVANAQNVSKEVVGELANNEGYFVDGTNFKIVHGTAKGDVSAAIAKLNAKEAGPGVIVFRSGDKLYIAQPQADPSPQAMQELQQQYVKAMTEFQDNWKNTYMKAMTDFQDNWKNTYMKDFQDNWKNTYMKQMTDFQDNWKNTYMKGMTDFQDNWKNTYMKAANDFQDNWKNTYMKDFQDNWKNTYMKATKDFQDNWSTTYMK